ncbi:MAG TPA: AMP-binding protein [Luteimonas sp.]|nr:AMP-binding protein [Luteimonas sp.]
MPAAHSTLPAADPRPIALAVGEPSRTIAFGPDGAVSLARFIGHVRGVAATLPEQPWALNLCEDRYRFMVAFCAVALRGQATLLPPARTRAAIDEVRARHADSYCLGDGDPCGCDALAGLPHYLRLDHALPFADGDMPTLAADALVAIGFTSGSTGTPGANAKHWGSLRTSTAQNMAALSGLWPDGATPHVVATVPPQHMYGMEMSVLLPLLGGAAVHDTRPFFPHDIARALGDAPGDRLLVTTPVHLRALLQSGLTLPPLAAITTATAPLSQALAEAAEARFGCEVRELFGSTETCVVASRRSARESAWTPYPGVHITPQPDGALVHAAHLEVAVALADLVALEPDGRFHLRGRQSDLLEIAGKRASLADLTRRLLAIDGVEDGVVLQLDPVEGIGRIAALVVAPTLDEGDITRALRAAIDPVFLPRPLRRVAELPRNETGKLPRAALLALLQGSIGREPPLPGCRDVPEPAPDV